MFQSINWPRCPLVRRNCMPSVSGERGPAEILVFHWSHELCNLMRTTKVITFRASASTSFQSTIHDVRRRKKKKSCLLPPWFFSKVLFRRPVSLRMVALVPKPPLAFNCFQPFSTAFHCFQPFCIGATICTRWEIQCLKGFHSFQPFQPFLTYYNRLASELLSAQAERFSVSRMRTFQSGCWLLALLWPINRQKMVSALLSTLVEIFSVSRLRDFCCKSNKV